MQLEIFLCTDVPIASRISKGIFDELGGRSRSLIKSNPAVCLAATGDGEGGAVDLHPILSIEHDEFPLCQVAHTPGVL